jgi:hypothetical protein
MGLAVAGPSGTSLYHNSRCALFRAPSGYATATLAPSKGRFQVDHVDRIDIAGIAALIADNGNIALGAHLDCEGRSLAMTSVGYLPASSGVIRRTVTRRFCSLGPCTGTLSCCSP